MNHEIAPLLTATLRRHYAADATLLDVIEQEQDQGFSGATLRRYLVTYDSADGQRSTTLLTKAAALPERLAGPGGRPPRP